MRLRTYQQLMTNETFEDRLRYLKLDGSVGRETFGVEYRMFNQDFYWSKEWKQVRAKVIARDLGCDMGLRDREIFGAITVHHMNPITLEDIEQHSDVLLNPNFLISVSPDTHKYIHFGIVRKDFDLPKERTPFDMCPWRK